MRTFATFEVRPPFSAVLASPFGYEPCSPPLLTLPDREIEIREADLLEILDRRCLTLEVPGFISRWWRISLACAFSPSCRWHRRGAIYLSMDCRPNEEDPATLLATLPAHGWVVNEEAVRGYRLGT